jgi:hypothetical protein
LIHLSLIWPDWLKGIESNYYPNPSFYSGRLLEHSTGYESECATFFPETISGGDKVATGFGVIFASREAQRLQNVCRAGAEYTNLRRTPQMEFFLSNLDAIEESFALWDLIHDYSHNTGNRPRLVSKEHVGAIPYWMNGLEELRVDLLSFLNADRLYREEHLAVALYTCWSILFDRIFRFPTVQPDVRKKDYDGLAGQVLTAALFQHGALKFDPGAQLVMNWSTVQRTVASLAAEIEAMEGETARASRESLWGLGYKLVTKYGEPALESTYTPGSRIRYTRSTQSFTDVLDDEFPRSEFHTNLRRRFRSLKLKEIL